MRRSFSLLVMLAVSITIVALVPLSVRASSHPFFDVNSSTQYWNAIETIAGRGAVQGYKDGSFKPTARINRAEFLKILFKLLGTGAPQAAPGNCFADVKTEWFSEYVCTAKKAGYVSGYDDGLFHPERDINFAEASKILSLAYKQKMQATGGEWYEPYITALESGKAIPPSVSAVDKKITRGEMAEMMWRIADKRTDQPTKGLLNIKYPSAQMNFASDAAQKAKSCADLRAIMNEEGSMRRNVMYEDVMGAPMMGAPAPMMKSMAAPTGSTAGSDDFSRTNVQVEGVDEADTVKTDGTYLYEVTSNGVKIILARPAESMRLASTVKIPSGTPSEIYVDGGRLVVLAEGWKNNPTPEPIPLIRGMMPDYYYREPSRQVSYAYLYDLKNGEATLVRTLSFDGNEVSSRLIAGKLYLVLRSGLRYDVPVIQMKDENLVPQYADSKAGNTDRPVARCGDITVLPHVLSPEYLTIASIPVDSSTGDVKTASILGNAQNVYASLQNIYVATTNWRYGWDVSDGMPSETTNIFRFSLADGGVAFASQGTVPGHILNQFSMDEYGETFRIATSVGHLARMANENTSSNNLYVLNRALETVGSIEDIAPGESIYSVRFMGDRTYMVTFKKVDPLFVIDTSDPRNPKILGKLKIPGYSDYLHPYDATHLIGFGKDAVDAAEGDFAWYQGMKIALFDVSDVSNPKELYSTVIGDRGTSSPLLSNHKALLFDKTRNLLAFPVTVYELTDAQKSASSRTGNEYGSPVFQGAYVYDLTIAGGFKKLGTITHYADDSTFMKSGSYWYGGVSDISRILRIQDSLLTVSQDQVKSTSWPGMKEEGSVKVQ